MHLCFIQTTQRVKNNCGWVALNAATLLFSEMDRLGAECIAGVRRWVALKINRSLKRQIWPYVVVVFLHFQRIQNWLKLHIKRIKVC